MNEQNGNSLNGLSFGFSENDDFFSSPLGSYPNGNDSPIGSRPKINESTLGSYPNGNDSPIGSRPRINESPLGSYPNGNDSPIGSRPRVNESPLGSYAGSGNSVSFTNSTGYQTESYKVNNFSAENSYNSADSYPPYRGFEQNSRAPYNSSVQSGYDAEYEERIISGNDYNKNPDIDRNNGNTVSVGRTLGAAPKIGRFIFSVWVILTMILTIILMIRGEKWSIIFELFQLIPLIAGFGAVSDRNKLRAAFIFLGVSAGFMSITAMLRFDKPKAFEYYADNLKANFLLLLFFLAAVMMITVPKIIYNARQRRCTEKVRAVIVDVKTQHSRTSKGHRTTTYCPTFEFEFRGQKYTATEGVYTNSYKPVKGRKADILFDPNNPKYITDIEMRTSSIYVLRFFGVFFCIMSVFAFFVQMANG